jgi:hypothetical protein
MLDALSEHGEDAGSDYHDGLDGYFGWTVHHTDSDEPRLEVAFTDVLDDHTTKVAYKLVKV